MLPGRRLYCVKSRLGVADIPADAAEGVGVDTDHLQGRRVISNAPDGLEVGWKWVASVCVCCEGAFVGALVAVW